MLDFKPVVGEILEELIELRHGLHAHPETAYEERRTAARITAELARLDALRIVTDVAGTGVVAVLNEHRTPPCVALRADMDALPLEEKTGFPYASREPGKMHACGHDGHMACLVGAARVLARFADRIPGAVKFIFQPAEEGGAGAQRMIEAGVLEAPRVDAAFALHGWPELPLGSVGVGPGPRLAAAQAFEITITGRGSHAAYPHQGSDVILAASHLICLLQGIRTRMIDPVEPAVISVCQMTAGDTHNILPNTCLMRGTVRALRSETHAQAFSLVEKCARSIAAAFPVEVEFRPQDPYPALLNDGTCAELVADVAAAMLGPDRVDCAVPAGMGGEDFAFFANAVPSAWWQLGLRRSGETEMPPLHNPRFDFPDDAIPAGVLVHCGIVERFLTAPPAWKCG